MNDNDETIIADFKRRLPEKIEKHVKKIIVFGSRASSKPSEDSDLDIAVLIDEKNPALIESLDDITYKVMWDHDFKPIISLKVFLESEFNDSVSRGFSFYENVLKKGISV